MRYERLAVTPSAPARREAVSAALFAAGAGGLLEDGATLIAVFADAGDARGAGRAAMDADADAAVAQESFEPGDYLTAWRDGVRAHRVGSLVIAPPWLAGEHDPANTIVIDPGTGFGTGEHETTRITLVLLQDAVRPGDFVADVGCGSGVLAIAAARLGAARVAAVETDHEAVVNAEGNIALNACAGRVTLIEADGASVLPLLAPLRVIAANIIATVLIGLFGVFDAALAPGGDLIVGGILIDERDEFVESALHAGWRVVREVCEGAWWGARLRRIAE